MSLAQIHAPTSRKPLRLWPGVLAAVLAVLGRFVIPSVVPGAMGVGVISGLVGALAIGVWWLFFSRAAWSERPGPEPSSLEGVAAIAKCTRTRSTSCDADRRFMFFPRIAGG